MKAGPAWACVVLTAVGVGVLTTSGAAAPARSRAREAASGLRQTPTLTLTLPTNETWGTPVTIVASGFAVGPSTLEVYDVGGSLPCPASPDLLVNNPAYGSVSPTRIDMPDSIPAGSFKVSDQYGSGPPAGLHRICGWLVPGNVVAGVLVREEPPTAAANTSTQACHVQNLVHQPFVTVQLTLMATRCKLGTVTRRSSSPANRGIVLAQTPKPGTTLKIGGRVSVVVGR